MTRLCPPDARGIVYQLSFVVLACARRIDVAAILVVVLTGVACGFFLYVLVQFRREEEQLKSHDNMRSGFPIAASGQIVIPLEPPREERGKDSAKQKAQERRRGS